MSYIIIGVVVLMIVAPILRILPSKRQKAVMAQRRVAMAEGVMVDITVIDDPNPLQEKYRAASGRRMEPRLEIAAWRRACKRSNTWQKEILMDWCAERHFEPAGGIALVADWYWTAPAEVSLVPAQKRQLLGERLGQLPDDVVRVEEKNGAVTVYWREREEDEAVRLVLDFLHDITAIVVVVDEE